MKRICVWCRPAHALGDVAPYDNPEETHGICAPAARRVDARREPLFFTPHVVETQHFHDEELTIR